MLPVDFLSPRWPVMAEEGTSHNKTISEVIIIGAGISGLSAANTLIKNGVTNFKILEARNKIGGRIEVTKMGKIGFCF